MGQFVWNPASAKSFNDQWFGYLQNQEYVGNHAERVKQFMFELRADYQHAFSQAAETQQALLWRAGQAVSELFQSGSEHLANISGQLDLLGEDLERIEATLSRGTALLDWRMSLLLEEEKIGNMLAQNMALLLRLPDSQKQRQRYIELGLKFMKNARFDSDLYQDALEHFLKAEAIDGTDYFVLQRIGLLYLYSGTCIDVAKAEAYFRRAGKYALVESQPEADRWIDLLAGNATEDLQQQQAISAEQSKQVATECFLSGAIACYIQGQFAKAAELAGKAFEIEAKNSEAGFVRAKALAASGRENAAAEVLQRVIEQDRLYALKTVADTDLANKPAIVDMLERLRQFAGLGKARQRLKDLKEYMVNHSAAKPTFEKLEAALTDDATYLASLEVLDEIETVREWRGRRLAVTDAVRLAALESTPIRLQFSHDGKYLALLEEGTASRHKLTLWDVKTKTKIATEEDCRSGSLHFSPDDAWIAVNGDVGAVKLYHTARKTAYRILCYREVAEKTAFDKGGRRLGSLSSGILRLWNIDGLNKVVK